MRALVVLLFAANAAVAQAPPATATARGSISGVVRVHGTGEPIADADVLARLSGAGARPVQTKSDSEGRYTLRALEPGSYTLGTTVRGSGGVGFGASATRPVVIQGEQELTGIDLRVRMPGQITGKVVDENGEPVAGINVMLVAREYSFGTLRHVIAGVATSDDQGRYLMSRVTPGRAFLLVAMKRQMRLPAISDAPDDPKLRRPVPLPTYYPDARTPEGGELLTLRVAERREGVDIRIRKAPSYCVEGVLSGPASPADLRFTIAPPRPHSGLSGDGGVYMGQPGGKPGPDGRVRICELPPGDYELEVTQWPTVQSFGGPDYMGVAPVTITDRDLANVRATALPKLKVAGEVVWDGGPPEKPLEAELSINLTAISRTVRPAAKSQVPGEFTFDEMPLDEYSMAFRGLSGRHYLKDVTYGGHSILNKTLRAGSAAADARMRVIVARDAAFLSAKVTDADGKPNGDAYVIVFPAAAGSEADVAAFLQTGTTDQNGSWRSPALAPGKYYVIAGEAPVDKSPESIDKLLRARNRAKEVSLQPNGTSIVTLEAKGIE